MVRLASELLRVGSDAAAIDLGFDPDTVDPSHLGLRSMRERAAEAGATFNLDTRSGGGTVITLDWEQES